MAVSAELMACTFPSALELCLTTDTLAWQVAALQQARLVKARAEEAEAARRAKAEEIARRKEQTRVAKVPLFLFCTASNLH